MKKYEAMFIIKPDLKEEEKTAVMKAIKEQVTKNHGVLSQDQIWAERRKLAYDLFPIGGQARLRKGCITLFILKSTLWRWQRLRVIIVLMKIS